MPSKRDRDKLRSRIKGLLDEEGRSQKDLEAALGRSSGTLTRVFSGKKNLDAELLAAVAEALDADPAALVDGTAWEALLGEQPPPPEPEPLPDLDSERVAASVAAESEPEPKPEPRKDPAREEPPREEPPREEPKREEPKREEPPPEERPPQRRVRKRDLPGRALRFLRDLIVG